MEKQRENQIEQDELFRFWFAGLKGIGNREKIQLTKEFPQKKTLYYIEETALKKRLKEKWTEGKAETITQIIQEGKRRWSKEIVAEWQKKGIALVTALCALCDGKTSGKGKKDCGNCRRQKLYVLWGNLCKKDWKNIE